MCFDLDSHPPIAPIAGGALDGMPLILTASDRNRFAAFRARAADPSGAAVVILPDVRGLHPYYEELALRFAENGIDALAIDWFGRTAGPEPRGEGFDHSPHVLQTTWAGISADITASVEELSVPDGDRPAPRAVFTLGFCMGGRMSFLAATLGLDLAGVMGMYGTLVGPWRNDAPAPNQVLWYIAPLGAGRPPAGSRVTAKAFTLATPGNGRTARLPVPEASTVNTPADTGALLPAMAQSWYALPAGMAGSPVATNTPPAVACHITRARAPGAGGRPARATTWVAGSRRIAITVCCAFSSARSWSASRASASSRFS